MSQHKQVICYHMNDLSHKLVKIMVIDGLPVKRIVDEDYDGRRREYMLFDDEIEHYSKLLKQINH